MACYTKFQKLKEIQTHVFQRPNQEFARGFFLCLFYLIDCPNYTIFFSQSKSKGSIFERVAGQLERPAKKFVKFSDILPTQKIRPWVSPKPDKLNQLDRYDFSASRARENRQAAFRLLALIRKVYQLLKASQWD